MFIIISAKSSRIRRGEIVGIMREEEGGGRDSTSVVDPLPDGRRGAHKSGRPAAADSFMRV